MYCSNCKTDGKSIIEEDETGIYYYCSNCDSSDEEYKTLVVDFLLAVSDDYEEEDVHEFANEHFQNLASLQENVDSFKEWITFKLEDI